MCGCIQVRRCGGTYGYVGVGVHRVRRCGGAYRYVGVEVHRGT